MDTLVTLRGITKIYERGKQKVECSTASTLSSAPANSSR